MTLILACGSMCCLVAAMFTDATTYRIPNALSLAVAAGALLKRADRDPALLGWRQALLLFAVSLCLYSRNVMGGGDVKLLAACALWLPDHMGTFLFVTACSGGLLALLYCARGLFKGRRPSVIPYGVAIGIGGLAGLWNIVSPALIG